MSATSAGSGETSLSKRRFFERTTWLIILVTPVLYALATFDPAGSRPALNNWLTFLSVPVMAAEVAAIACAMAAGFHPLQSLGTATTVQRLSLVGIIAIAFGTAAFVAPDPQLASIRNIWMLIHLLFGLTVFQLSKLLQGAELRRIACGLAAAAAGYVILACIYSILAAQQPVFDWTRFGLATNNVRQTGFYCTVGSGVTLGLAVVSRGWLRCIGWSALCAIFFAFVTWTGSRSALISVPVAVVVSAALLLPRHAAIRSGCILLCSMVAGFLLSMPWPTPSPAFGWRRILGSVKNAASVDEAGSGRIEMWMGTLSKIAERPWFGYGESQFRLVVPESGGTFNHPHNALLQLLLQWGTVGTTLVMFLVIPLLWRGTLSVRANWEERLPAFLILMGLLTFSLYEGALYHSFPISMIVLCLALLLGAPMKSPAR